MLRDSPLKEILLRDQIVTPEDLKRAIEEQERSGGELSRILLRLKLVAEDDRDIKNVKILNSKDRLSYYHGKNLFQYIEKYYSLLNN